MSNECHAYDMLAQTRALVPLRAGGSVLVSEQSFRTGPTEIGSYARGESRSPTYETELRQAAIGNNVILAGASVGSFDLSPSPANAIAVNQWNDLNTTGIWYRSGTIVSPTNAVYTATTSENLVNIIGASVSTGITISIVSHGMTSLDPSPSFRIEEVKQQCLAIVARLDNSLTRKVSNSVKLQLINLFRPEEWDESEPLPTTASFSSAIAFLAVNNELRAPSITIARTNFVFSFLKNRDRSNAVHLEFEGDGWVTFIVSLTPVGHYPKAPRAAMRVPFDEVRSHLELLGVWNWLAA